MKSLYEELSEKIDRDPRLTRRGGPRADLGLLIFNARAEINALWNAADRAVLVRDAQAVEELANAVEALRPIFGERNRPARGR